MRTDTATFDGKLLSGVRHYDFPQPHTSEPALEVVGFDNPEAHYWVACNGNCYAFKALTPGLTCIALVDSMMREVTGCHAYVIWKPKNIAPSAIKRWQATWGNRTNQNAPSAT